MKSLNELTEAGEVIKIKLEGDNKANYYGLTNTLENISRFDQQSERPIYRKWAEITDVM